MLAVSNCMGRQLKRVFKWINDAPSDYKHRTKLVKIRNSAQLFYDHSLGVQPLAET